MSEQTPQLLQGYWTRKQLAEQIGVTERTLLRWEQLRIGPPRTVVNRQIFFRVSSVQKWLESREVSRKR